MTSNRGAADFEEKMHEVMRRLTSIERHRHATPLTGAFGQVITTVDDEDPDPTPPSQFIPPAPGQPVLESRAGVDFVTWTGLDITDRLMDPRVVYVEVHRQALDTAPDPTVPANADFQPSDSTYVGRMTAPGPGTLTLHGGAYGSRWYYRLVAVTQAGRKSEPSLADVTDSTPLDGFERRAYASNADLVTSAGFFAVLASLPSSTVMPGGTFTQRTGQKLRARMHGTLVGAGAKSVLLSRVDANGANEVVLGGMRDRTEAGTFAFEVEVWPLDSGSQMSLTQGRVGGGTLLTASGSAADATVDWSLRLTANSGDATSTVSVRMFELFVTG